MVLPHYLVTELCSGDAPARNQLAEGWRCLILESTL
jgi:hypothetical protein